MYRKIVRTSTTSSRSLVNTIDYSYGRLCSQFTSVSLRIYQVCHLKKIIYSSKRCARSETDFLVQEFFFVLFLVF